MASLLFGISATDPLTFISISLVLLAVEVGRRFGRLRGGSRRTQ
jgi:hypothetical protein